MAGNQLHLSESAPTLLLQSTCLSVLILDQGPQWADVILNTAQQNLKQGFLINVVNLPVIQKELSLNPGLITYVVGSLVRINLSIKLE